MDILKKWHSTANSMKWNIAYRTDCESIIVDKTTPFRMFDSGARTWAADPFVFEYDNKHYLFYELYLESKNKGVIAVSEWINGCFSSPQIVIEESFHLSFPCIFEIDGAIYMIPETGSQKKLFLYKCDSFPEKWHIEKKLISNINSSDTIIYSYEGKYFILASLLKGSASYAENVIYQLDPNTMCTTFVKKVEGEGINGYRNAGFLFHYKDQWYRPGQNCKGYEYGKVLSLWKVKNMDGPRYEEALASEITVDTIDVNKKYCGIHTLNRCGNIEVIDLKFFAKNSILKRVRMMLLEIFKYIKIKIKVNNAIIEKVHK